MWFFTILETYWFHTGWPFVCSGSAPPSNIPLVSSCSPMSFNSLLERLFCMTPSTFPCLNVIQTSFLCAKCPFPSGCIWKPLLLAGVQLINWFLLEGSFKMNYSPWGSVCVFLGSHHGCGDTVLGTEGSKPHLMSVGLKVSCPDRYRNHLTPQNVKWGFFVNFAC